MTRCGRGGGWSGGRGPGGGCGSGPWWRGGWSDRGPGGGTGAGAGARGSDGGCSSLMRSNSAHSSSVAVSLVFFLLSIFSARGFKISHKFSEIWPLGASLAATTILNGGPTDLSNPSLCVLSTPRATGTWPTLLCIACLTLSGSLEISHKRNILIMERLWPFKVFSISCFFFQSISVQFSRCGVILLI